MKTMLEYLDLVKVKKELPSDYALAKTLDVTRETISQMRRGKMHMSEAIALRVASILEIDPIEVFVSATMERSQLPEAEAIWKGLLEKISASFNALLSGSWSGPERRRDYVSRLAFTR